ncbi:MAG: SRPBCC family protein [Candidatus Nanopelagicales bacterium]
MSTAASIPEAKIEADPNVPIIRITRDFQATPEQLMRAHTDPDLFAQWIGPSNLSTKIDYWDARSGGSWRFINVRDDDEYAFRGCFHEIGANKIVQTFTWEGQPDGVSLETIVFERIDETTTRLVAQSLVDSFEGRDAWLSSGMETGVNEGYAKLEELIRSGAD